MKRVKIAEFKNRFSEYVRAAEKGAEIEIRDRDRPVARLSPVSRQAEARIVPARRRFAEVRGKRYPAARWSVSSLDILREERGRR
jgi:prevent-host-death family protein